MTTTSSKTNTDLFSCFINNIFVGHPIIRTICGRHGNAAFHIITILLQMLREQSYCLRRTKLLVDYIMAEVGVDAELVDNVIDLLIEYEFFDLEMAQLGRLTSADIQRTWFSKVLRKSPTTDYPDLLIDAAEPAPKQPRKRPAASATPQPATARPAKVAPLTQTSPDSAPPRMEMKEIVNQMIDDTDWQQQIERQHNLDKGSCRDWIEEFYSYCLSSQRNHCHTHEMRRHFSNWLPMRLRKMEKDEQKRREQEEKSQNNLRNFEKMMEELYAQCEPGWRRHVLNNPHLFPKQYEELTGEKYIPQMNNQNQLIIP